MDQWDFRTPATKISRNPIGRQHHTPTQFGTIHDAAMRRHRNKAIDSRMLKKESGKAIARQTSKEGRAAFARAIFLAHRHKPRRLIRPRW
jgi:hypothetical protein